jgi:hypothetical protein
MKHTACDDVGVVIDIGVCVGNRGPGARCTERATATVGRRSDPPSSRGVS